MMTQLEHDALICLHYQMHFPLELMSQYCVREWELARSFNSALHVETAETYQVALEGMIGKGWLKIVATSRAVRLAQHRAKGWIIPPDVWWVPEKGVVTFTQRGFRLYRRALRARGEVLEETLELLDETSKTLVFIGSSKAVITRRLHFLFDGDCSLPRLEAMISDLRRAKSVRVIKVDEPVRIGRWFVREAHPHLSGWKFTVHFAPAAGN